MTLEDIHQINQARIATMSDQDLTFFGRGLFIISNLDIEEALEILGIDSSAVDQRRWNLIEEGWRAAHDEHWHGR